MLTPTQLSDFAELGFVRIAGFSRAEAAAMEDRVWQELARVHGIRRDDRESWRPEMPTGLQAIRERPVFDPVAGRALSSALDELLGAGAWRVPKRWGNFLVTFPVAGRDWTVPSAVWHVDFSYALPAEPLPGVKLFMFLGDVPARGGGTFIVSGSHRVVREFVAGRRRAELENMRRIRLQFLASQPWLRELSGGDTRADRIHRFMDVDEVIDGVPVRVVELSGSAGDIVLTHPWTLHCPSVNCADRPRLMRAQNVQRLAATAAMANDRAGKENGHAVRQLLAV